MGKKKLCDGESKDKAHYWVLDDKSFGVCKKCGAKRQFDIYCEWEKANVVIGKKSHSQTH